MNATAKALAFSWLFPSLHPFSLLLVYYRCCLVSQHQINIDAGGSKMWLVLCLKSMVIFWSNLQARQEITDYPHIN